MALDIAVQTGVLFETLGVENAFRLLHEAGFDAVDFNINNSFDYPTVRAGGFSVLLESTERAIEHFAPYREFSQKYGVRIHQMHAPFPTYLLDGTEEFNEQIFTSIVRSLEVAAYLECPYMIVHPAHFQTAAGLEKEATWELNKQLFTRLIPHIRETGVEVCLENMFRSCNGRRIASACALPSEALFYVNSLNEIAGERLFSFCFDTGHAFLQSLDLYTAMVDLKPILTTFHIHDNDGIEDRHQLPGAGRIDWARFVEGLKTIDFQGTLSLETFNSLNLFPQAVWPELLKLEAATARHFADLVEGSAEA